METKVPLSVVILAKNETGRLRECMASVRWADEIVVVDDESTDGTPQLAESLGGRLLRRKMDIEGRQRNWAHVQAKHEWVLSLDADERVTPELASEIQQLFRDGPSYETYAIGRRNYIGGYWVRHGGWYPSQQLKLFKRSVFRWEETTVHPRAIADCPCGVLKSDLLHFSYRDLADFIEKLNRQTSLEAEKWVRDGRRFSAAKAWWRTVDRFFRSYVGKRGYRDGFWGLATSTLGGLYQFLAWIKYTEYRQAWRVEDVVEPFGSLVVDEERYDRSLLMSHLCAYRQAGSLSRDRQVLEIGSGSGYGAFYLSHVARDVTAIDADTERIAQAQRLFRRPNLRYVAMQGQRLDVPDASFDVVGTFQVIEHIPEPELPMFVGEIARVLRPDGALIVSTLNVEYNRKGRADYQKPGFHEKEFTAPELEALLRSVFGHVEMYGLYPARRYRLYHRLKRWGLDRWGPAAKNPVRRFYASLDTDDHRLRGRPDDRAIDLIAICRKQV
ncbi:MAG: methyltransferase domain-containing protein [Candidatus Omnitrophica bacterium]|nr:methyltransferase domain-containing protein [Candidatus Omnitrophota bacterium]